MSKSLFFKLIKCENCGYNYRYISDRKIKKYICSGYSRQLNNGCKTRYAIKEDELIYMIQIFCNRNDMQIEYTNDFMKSIIDRIYINRESDSIEIIYKNHEKSTYSRREVQI